MSSKKLGNLGEKIAEKYLKNKGYQILDKNYSFRILGNGQKGEIDLVAKKGEVFSFIEVKTSTLSNLKNKQGGFRQEVFPPELRVNLQKKRKLIKTAESWLMKKGVLQNQKWQIDVISVTVDQDNKKAKIRHFENAIFKRC